MSLPHTEPEDPPDPPDLPTEDEPDAVLLLPGSRSVGLKRVLTAAETAAGPENRKLFITLGFLAVVTGIFETLALFLMARLALAVTGDKANPTVDLGPLGTMSVRSGVVVGLVVLGILILIAIPSAHVEALLSSRALVRARTRVLQASLQASWDQWTTDREGRLQDLVGDYAERTELLMQQVALIMFSGLALVVICIGAIAVAPLVALVGFVLLSVLGLIARPAISRMASSAGHYVEANKDLSSEVAQTARMSQEILAFDVGPQVERHLQVGVLRSEKTLFRVRFIGRATRQLFLYGAMAAIFGVVGAAASSPNGSTLNTLGPMLLILVRGLGYVRYLQTASQTGIELVPYVEAVERAIDERLANPIQPGARHLDRMGALAFDHVGFEYTAGHPVLMDTTFQIQTGTAVGIIGPSGSGKSTLAQLLLRLRQPTTGSVRIGDVDLADVDPSSWAALVALVPQDNKLTRATIADNIRFFREGFSDEAVELAARRAHLHEDVLRLPDRYDTVVGPGERSLSGGQAQRLGIARALLAQPKLLILDEPTSALDARSEELIRQTLEELRGSTTLVLIAHRPATLEVCDAVLRIEQGRVTTEQLTPSHPRDGGLSTDASPQLGAPATDGAVADAGHDGHDGHGGHGGQADGSTGAPVRGGGATSPDDAAHAPAPRA